MKDKNILVVLLFAISIIAHAWITKPIEKRYEVVSVGNSSYVVIDHIKDKIYQYYFDPNVVGSDKPEEIIFPE